MNRFLEETLQKPSSRFYFQLEGQAWAPKANIYQMEHEIRVLVELPGIESNDEVNLEARPGVLNISGIRQPPDLEEEAIPLIVEGQFGPFQRLIQLPDDADTSTISATMEAGILEIRVLRIEKKRHLRVEIVEIK